VRSRQSTEVAVERAIVPFFPSFFLFRNCMPIVTEPRRKSHRTDDGRGKASRGAEHFSPHSSIIHLRSSLGSSFFYSTLDLRTMLIHSNSKRLLARSEDAARRARFVRSSSRMRALRSRFDMYSRISDPNAYVSSACVRAHTHKRERKRERERERGGYRAHPTVSEWRTWAWH